MSQQVHVCLRCARAVFCAPCVAEQVYIAGAGPVGLAAAASAHLLGAACVIVGDLIPDRLKQAKALGYETIDVSAGPVKDQLVAILGVSVLLNV